MGNFTKKRDFFAADDRQPRRGAYPRARTDRQQSPAEKPKTVMLCRRDKHRLSGIRNECNLPEANDGTGSRYSTGQHRPSGDLFRYAEPGAWIRAPTYADANNDTGSRYSNGLHRPCGRFVPLRGTGRVDTRPYKALLSAAYFPCFFLDFLPCFLYSIDGKCRRISFRRFIQDRSPGSRGHTDSRVRCRSAACRLIDRACARAFYKLVPL